MKELENIIESPTKENIIHFLEKLKLEYNNIPNNRKKAYIEELEYFMIYIISSSERIQKDSLGKRANCFMICIQDYWLVICWYLITLCKEPFLDNINIIIDMCKNEWLIEDCYNLNDEVMSDLMNLSEEKFNLISILENSKLSFYYFNIPFKNRYTECHAYQVSGLANIFELYGVYEKDFPLQVSFSHLLGLGLYFYILEKKPKLIDAFKKEFSILEEDCSMQFGEYFAVALLQFTDYDVDGIDLKTKEKYTRYFEKLTSDLRVSREISKYHLCPCGSGKKYGDCCKKKDIKWVTVNGEINKELRINKIISNSFKNIISEFYNIFGRKPYNHERIFKLMGFNDGSYENIFSKMVDENIPLDKQYATLKTGMFLTEYNYDQYSDLDIKEWYDALEEYKIKDSSKIYDGKSIFEMVREVNHKLKNMDKYIKNIQYVISTYLNTFPINYDFSNLIVETQKDFSMVCARKLDIDINIILSAFSHKSVEEATNITRIIFEDLIQIEILLSNKEIFEEKIMPLALFEKGLLEYKKSTDGHLSKNILINKKTGKEYNVKINISDFSLKSKKYKKIYDELFDGLCSFIHLNINKIPRYFGVTNPLTEVQDYKTVCLLGLFLLNQCMYEIKTNVMIDRLLLRDMEYIYNKNANYIKKCLKMLLLLDSDNEIYKFIMEIQKECFKTINPDNIIKLS